MNTTLLLRWVISHLEDANFVDSARDLFDEDRCQPLGAQLLVHAQEVNLDHSLQPARQSRTIQGQKALVIYSPYKDISNGSLTCFALQL